MNSRVNAGVVSDQSLGLPQVDMEIPIKIGRRQMAPFGMVRTCPSYPRPASTAAPVDHRGATPDEYGGIALGGVIQGEVSAAGYGQRRTDGRGGAPAGALLADGGWPLVHKMTNTSLLNSKAEPVRHAMDGQLNPPPPLGHDLALSC